MKASGGRPFLRLRSATWIPISRHGRVLYASRWSDLRSAKPRVLRCSAVRSTGPAKSIPRRSCMRHSARPFINKPSSHRRRREHPVVRRRTSRRGRDLEHSTAARCGTLPLLAPAGLSESLLAGFEAGPKTTAFKANFLPWRPYAAAAAQRRRSPRSSRCKSTLPRRLPPPRNLSPASEWTLEFQPCSSPKRETERQGHAGGAK